MGADHKKFIKAMRWEKRVRSVERTREVWKNDGEKEEHADKGTSERETGCEKDRETDRPIKYIDTD